MACDFLHELGVANRLKKAIVLLLNPLKNGLGFNYGRLCDWRTDSPKMNGPNDERTPLSVL